MFLEHLFSAWGIGFAILYCQAFRCKYCIFFICFLNVQNSSWLTPAGPEWLKTMWWTGHCIRALRSRRNVWALGVLDACSHQLLPVHVWLLLFVHATAYFAWPCGYKGKYSFALSRLFVLISAFGAFVTLLSFLSSGFHAPRLQDPGGSHPTSFLSPTYTQMFLWKAVAKKQMGN